MSYYNLINKTKRLSEAELDFYFQAYKNGDMTARAILIERNTRLVETIVKKYDTNYDTNDLIQIGCIGLIKAVDTFDMNMHSKFSNYAGICIDNEIRMFFRKNNKHINNMSMDDATNKSIIENTFSYEVADFVLDYEDKEQMQILINLIDSLPEMDRDFIRLYFGLCGNKRHNYQEIADKFGKSRFIVSRRINGVIGTLRSQIYESFNIKDQRIKH